MCFRGPHLCSKIPKINIQGLELGRTQCKGRVAGNPWFTWCNPGVGITTRPVYTVCASAVISPLRQWLVSYAKTRFKMCHTFKHLFICNTFCCRPILLSLSLYTELALVCCTNPNNVNCFGTIFPNLNFVFASNLSRPPGPYWIRPIGGLPMCVLSYIFAWHRGSSGLPPWVRLLHSLGHCHLARLCKIYSAQRYETVNGLATNVPLHYPEFNWSGCLYDLNIGIKNEWNKI